VCAKKNNQNDSPGTDLAVLSPDQYPALNPDNPVLALIQENLQGEPLSLLDLRVPMPTGGATVWTLPEGKTVPALEGVLIHTSRRRAWWGTQDLGAGPPLCTSSDCLHGIGTPNCECPKNEDGTWNCQLCPQSQPGSKPEAGPWSRNCNEGRLLLLLSPGRPLPLFILSTPGSISNLKHYLAMLVGQGLSYWQLITHLALEAAANAGGKKYAKIKPTPMDRLDPKMYPVIRALQQQYVPVIAAFQVQRSDFVAEANG